MNEQIEVITETEKIGMRPREKIYMNPCFTLDPRKHIMDKMRIRDKFTKFVGTI